MEAMLVVIQNDKDHARAKALVAELMASDRQEDRARMTAQARLIEAYEQVRWPRRRVSVAEVLIYLLDQHGLTRSDLAPVLGTPSRVSEVLNGKRSLSIGMVRKLRERFHVSADLLIACEPRRTGKRLAA